MNEDRFAKMMEDNISRQQWLEEYMGQFPRESEIEKRIEEAIYWWSLIGYEQPRFLILGTRSYLELWAVYHDWLIRDGYGPGAVTQYRGMTVITVPIEDFVEVGGDVQVTSYVKDRRPPHMGKKETDNEDDETGVSEGPGGTGPDDDSPQGETWEGPAIVPSSAGA